MRLVPATLAALIQCAALLSVVITSAITSWVNSLPNGAFSLTFPFSIFILVLMQAVFAASFAYLANMASWWHKIHFCFPILAWITFEWHIPNAVYLVGFLISLSLFWTTFRTQVPFFPSRPAVWQQVANIIAKERPLRLIDIGSGLGDMAMHMAKTRPDCQIQGIEIAPLPWLISVIRAKLRSSSAKFILGNYQSLNFANYEVIFAYLSPAAMLLLWEKASQEMQAGAMLISLEFAIPGVPWRHVNQPGICYSRGAKSLLIPANKNTPAIYIWIIS